MIYEADEFDRNFLSFKPYLSVITNIDYDHPDTYSNQSDYFDAFKQFCKQSKTCICLKKEKIKLDEPSIELPDNLGNQKILLPGNHNRVDAQLAVTVFHKLTNVNLPKLIEIINKFPGTERRFEKLSDNLYTDYAHHPTEIKATINAAKELNGNVVVVYQPHQNLRQNQIKKLYKDTFNEAKKVYWLPTYLSREPSTNILTPSDLIQYLNNPEVAELANLDNELWQKIKNHINSGDLVVAMGAGSIDEWLRESLNK